jgi:broad specificity phosphatase PhoE
MTEVNITTRPLVLVRHGESTWNQLRLIQGQNDQGRLTDAGREQAFAVARELSAHDFDLIVSSDLHRASETAEIIARVLGIEVVTDQALRERSFGEAEGGYLDDLDVDLIGIRGGVVVDDNVSTKGGETLRALRERAGRFVLDCTERRAHQRLLVITHGGTIRALRNYCEASSFQGAAWDRVDNCSVWTISPPPTF